MPRFYHGLYVCTKFGLDSSGRFPFRARTDKQTHTHTNADATDHPTHASATAGMGNYPRFFTVRV